MPRNRARPRHWVALKVSRPFGQLDGHGGGEKKKPSGREGKWGWRHPSPSSKLKKFTVGWWCASGTVGDAENRRTTEGKGNPCLVIPWHSSPFRSPV